MKRILLTLLIFAVYSAAQVLGPKISFNEMQFDFGEIPAGPGVYHDFIVTNTGDASLEIERVKASCGCTAVKPDKNVLAPNESAAINVNFSTYGRSGVQKKYVYVFSNDPDQPETRLMFTANIVKNNTPEDAPVISVDRKIFNLGEVMEGNVYDLQVEIKNDGLQELKISKVKTSCGCTSTKLEKQSLAPGEDVSLKIELNTEGRTGKWSRTVTIFSNDPVRPEETITVVCNVKERKS